MQQTTVALHCGCVAFGSIPFHLLRRCGRMAYLAACFDRDTQPVSTNDDESFFGNTLGCQVARPLIHALPQALHVVSPLPPDYAQALTGSVQHSAVLNRQDNCCQLQQPSCSFL